jgi:hypothetical protein
MPWGDGTGPAGLGPMTGRGAGYCAGYPTPGYANPYGRGWGMGMGRGWWPGFRGRGRRFLGRARSRGLRRGYAPYGPYGYSPY